MKKIISIIYYLFVYPIYKLRFKRIGYRTRIRRPLTLMGSKRISIGSKTLIERFAWLAGDNGYGGRGSLTIGAHSYIGNYAHIYATDSIEIGNEVLIADKVYISDNAHKYEDVSISVIKQGVKQLSPVIIGDGAWIGENVCVIGVTIGKHSIIGANSVVNKNIPEYSIAVGAPAKIIKRFNFETKTWAKTDAQGNFIKQ